MKKKTIFILTILILTLCLTAFASCDTTPENPEQPTQPEQPTKPEQPEETEKPEQKDSYTKVIILSGQSNAVGFADRTLLQSKIESSRYQALLKPAQNIKMISLVGSDPLETITVDTFANVTMGGGGMMSYDEDSFGPEVGIAETLSQQYPDETVYIIKCAFGGASLYQDFQSPSMAAHISYLYKILTDMIDGGLHALKEANLNPKIVGFCWMQGEADASRSQSSEGHWDRYYDNLTKFVKDLRERYNADSLDGTMRFIDAYIHDHFEFHKTVNNQKLRFSKASEYNYVINTLAPNLVSTEFTGLTAKYEPSVSIKPLDPLHYDSTSMLKLGNMFGDAIVSITK